MKMEKTPRYTQRERNMVLGFAAQYKEVIENKRTDAESNRKKDDVWRQIAKEFNARVYHQRSSKQLRQLYKNMKLLLKKDLCGDDKGNRSFMDLLNTLSQQESVAQYISEQMSPSGYSSSRQQKYDDEYDDSKLPSVGFDGMDTDVIVIKSEDISDNEQSQHGGDMDDDDDDCLSPKDMPEVCLEEEDDEIFATDLRQPLQPPQSTRQQLKQNAQQSQTQQLQQPEITIKNVGGIRVGSIGSLANLKSLQNGNNSALSITQAINSASATSTSNTTNNNHSSGTNSANNRQTSAEQAQQHLLLNGLGLSAVGVDTPLPTLQRGSHSNSNNNNSNSILNGTANQLLQSLNSSSGSHFGHKSQGNNFGHLGIGNNNSSSSTNNNRNNDYLMSLAIEERKRKIDLLNAQIEYWKTLTRKLDANTGHNPTPSCLCHFPGKVNGLPAQANSS